MINNIEYKLEYNLNDDLTELNVMIKEGEYNEV